VLEILKHDKIWGTICFSVFLTPTFLGKGLVPPSHPSVYFVVTVRDESGWALTPWSHTFIADYFQYMCLLLRLSSTQAQIMRCAFSPSKGQCYVPKQQGEHRYLSSKSWGPAATREKVAFTVNYSNSKLIHVL